MGRQAVFQSNLGSFTSNNHTLSVTVPSGLSNRILVITKSCNNNLPWTSFTSITVNGSSAGIVDAGTSGNALAARSIRTWYLLAPAVGTYDVQLSFSTSSMNGGLLTAVLYDNVDQATPIADFKSVSSGSAATPVTVSSLGTPAGASVLAHARALSATSATPGGGATTLGTAATEEAVFEPAAGATSASCAWGGTSPTQVSIIALALKPAAAGDTTPPTLSSPTGAQTGSATASGGVTTDEGNGTLYGVVSTSGTAPTSAQVRAGQTHTGSAAAYASNQSVTSTGAKGFSATGLSASTTYYWHFTQRDAASNDSLVVSSASFTTAASDTTAPILSSPTGAQTGTTTASGGVTTDEANGTLYAVCTTSATAPTALQVEAGQNQAGAAAPYATNQAITTAGAKTVGATGLTPGTTYYWHFMHKDGAGNRSTVVSSSSFSTAPITGSFTTGELRLAGVRQNGVAVKYTLYVGATMADWGNLSAFTAEAGTGTTSASGPSTLTRSGHTLGAGLVLFGNLSGTCSAAWPVTVV